MERNSQWIKEGEKLSPSFFQLGKNPARQKYIPKLFIESQPQPNGQLKLTKKQDQIKMRSIIFIAIYIRKMTMLTMTKV